ncbi:hypothetical protein AgCh_014002 [Apium graveolens]
MRKNTTYANVVANDNNNQGAPENNIEDEYSALEPVVISKCECKCGSHKLQEDREQRKKLLQFLMGLNEGFPAARCQILMMNPLPSVPQAYSMVKQGERQRQGYNVNSSFLDNANAKKVQQFSVGNPGSDGSVGGSSIRSYIKKQDLKCNYCHKEGHLKESCYKLIGFPPGYSSKGR